MHILRTILICIFATTLISAYGKTPNDSLMNQLDQVIANRDIYLSLKEKRLNQLRNELSRAADDRQRFDFLNHLYDEYVSFNTDSAYNISLREEQVARRTGDKTLIANALMNRANIYSATGMYYETLSIMDSIHRKDLPEYLHPYYFHILRTLYGHLADFANFDGVKRHYLDLTDQYRDSIISVNAPGTLANVITRADMLNKKGKPEEAVRVLNEYIGHNELSEHDHAICAWSLAESYEQLGDHDKRKEMLLRSSISDMKSSVREYMSLRALAMMLYEEGDLNRAYQLMTIAMDDATKCNARLRIIELNNAYPKKRNIYIKTVQRQKRTLEWTIAIITILSLLLLAMIFYLRKQMRRIARSRKETQLAYYSLNKITEQLKVSNEHLSEANVSIAEISEMKEVYIGRYMDQCLIYIEKLDAYRKSIGRLIGDNRMDELKKMIKSSTLVDNELKMFYDQFDKTFLSLFPTFVTDFNTLLMPDEAIVQKKPGTLTPELRIFALIRLGIHDSDRIATFLRYSVTTIYNYRTKIRNKACGDRNRLEAEVMKIGRVNRNKS